ncbi:MAG: hypothetical protein HYZ63_00255 [Candidatus Andersenbacteria bacterium]|nr:hypothetical protein [Candidatus Andersenbacteria bacterium]
MKKRSLDFGIAVGLLLIAGALTQVRADLPFLFLLPTPGAANQVGLVPDTTYEYTFQVNQALTLTRFGFYFAPAGSLPPQTLTLAISQAGLQKGQAQLSGVFIDSEGPSFWQFRPALKLEAGQAAVASLQIPAEFAHKIKVKLRQPDESFRAEETNFRISGQSQSTPLAYAVYAGYTPPLAPQLAVIAALVALYLIIKPHRPFLQDIAVVAGAVALTAAYLFPAAGSTPFPWFLLATQSGAVMAVFWYLKGRGFHGISAAPAAAIIAYSSWLPLQYSAGRFLYGLIVPVALLGIFLAASQPLMRRRLALGIAALLTLFVFTLPIQPAAFDYSLDGYSNLRDVLLDPYQVPHAEKATSATPTPIAWHNFGAYIGIPAGLAAIIGLVSGWRRHRKLALLTLGVALLLSLHLPPPFSIVIAHSSIFLVVLLAYFAALGLENIRKFLGYEDKLVRVLVTLVALIVTLDIWHTVSDVLNHLR